MAGGGVALAATVQSSSFCPASHTRKPVPRTRVIAMSLMLGVLRYLPHSVLRKQVLLSTTFTINKPSTTYLSMTSC